MPKCERCGQEMEYTGEGGNPYEPMYVCFNKECGINETELVL